MKPQDFRAYVRAIAERSSFRRALILAAIISDPIPGEDSRQYGR